VPWNGRSPVASTVINLSLGTANPTHRKRFEEVLAQAGRAIIVSAFEHQGCPLFPGSLDPVIAVTLDWDCPRDEFRVAPRDGRPVFQASGYPRSIPGVPLRKNLHGISFAVANMTGFVARELAAGASNSTLQARLIERAAESTVTRGVSS